MSWKSDRKRQIKEGARRLFGATSATELHAQKKCLSSCPYCKVARMGPSIIRYWTPEQCGKRGKIEATDAGHRPPPAASQVTGPS
jgi:hypothetical protein